MMWDQWETKFGCPRRVVAELYGYRRSFNKGSVKNWGSMGCPCPTLNLAADPSRTCKGVAFEFPEEQQQKVIDYLNQREGKGFQLQQREIELEDGNRVNAIVAIYSGKNLLTGRSYTELAAMTRTAKGDNGECVDYVRNIKKKLAELGIDDPDVDEFWRVVS